MPLTNNLTEQEALQEVTRIHGRAESRARWHGWAWLILGIATFVFIIANPPGPDNGLSMFVALGFGVLGAVLWFLESRLKVIGRVAARIAPAITRWYFGLVILVTLLHIFVLPDGYTVWLMLAAMLPTVPCLIGAWTVLRS